MNKYIIFLKRNLPNFFLIIFISASLAVSFTATTGFSSHLQTTNKLLASLLPNKQQSKPNNDQANYRAKELQPKQENNSPTSNSSKPVQAANENLALVKLNKSTVTSNNLALNNTNSHNSGGNTVIAVNINSSLESTGNTFTLQTLALHNKVNDCFVAYQGKVYNLSNIASWGNCVHQGTGGGIDVTPLFPHPVSYFNNIPVVGALSNAVNLAATTANNTNNLSLNKGWKESESDKSNAENFNED